MNIVNRAIDAAEAEYANAFDKKKYNTSYKRFNIIIDALARRGHACDIQRVRISKTWARFDVLVDFEIVKRYKTRESAKRYIARYYLNTQPNEKESKTKINNRRHRT